MSSLKFYIKPNDEYNRVRIRYTYNRDSRADFFCGVNLSSYDNFDKDNELNPIKKKEADSEYKNNQLKHIKRTIEDVIQSLRLNKKTPTALLVKQKYKVSKINQFENTDVEARINTFFIVETIDEYISHLRGRVSIGDNMRLTTFQKNSRIMERWKDFFKSKKQISIQFEELRNRYTLFREFAEWAIKNHSFANSSVNKYNSTFRNFLRWGLKMDYHNIDLGRFDSPNLKEVSNRTVLALTSKQLQTIYNFTDFHYNINGEFNPKCETYKKKEERYFFVDDVFNQKKYDKDDNVEIMICDIKSYLYAMYYMNSFNKTDNMIMYWDEPTITMDYVEHEFHSYIADIWQKNIIPNIVLSSATLPHQEDLQETIADFTSRFENSQVFNIVSHDCNKSIPMINKQGFAVLPHLLYENIINRVKNEFSLKTCQHIRKRFFGENRDGSEWVMEQL